MDFGESVREASERLVLYATTQGSNVAPLRNYYNVFENPTRWIELWLEDDHFGYHLSGEIGKLPNQFAQSQSSFRGVWDEAGLIDDLHQAFCLLHSWLIEAKEVDELPRRTIHRCMI
jgi:hypothetical protein